MKITCLVSETLIVIPLFCLGCQKAPREIQRPEQIKSIRQVMYDSSTYAKLAQLWKDYYDAYPSEDACANWMYAEEYALSDNYGKEREDFNSMLEKGLDRFIR